MLANLAPSVPYDMLGALFFYALIIGIVTFIVVVLIETVILRRMKWGSTWRSLFDAFWVNLITTGLGFFALLLAGGLENVLTFFYELVSRPVIAVLEHITGETYYWGLFLSEFEFVVVALVTWAISVALESGMLLRTKRQPARRTWKISLIMNTVSYVALIVAWISLRLISATMNSGPASF